MSMADALGGSGYSTVKEIGRGGVGIVLEAQDLRIHRAVAKKILRAGKGASPTLLQRFVREARVTGQLQHPNIVPIYELSEDETGGVFYTMRLVHGISLDESLTGLRAGRADLVTRFPLRALLVVFLKVCDAIGFAHSRGVIHRDLKPANIMIGEYGEVLVMDWGMAKLLHAGAETTTPVSKADPDETITTFRPADGSLTLNGDILGTPNFMSPEQAEGQQEAVDQRADIYALGAILYNLLTLQAPINATSVASVLLAVKAGHIRPPTSFNPSTRRPTGAGTSAAQKPISSQNLTLTQDRPAATPPPGAGEASVSQEGGKRFFPHCPGGRIPSALSAVTMKALAARPEDRYESVQELQQEIEAYLSGFATRAEQAGVWKQAALFVRRNRKVSVTVGVALVVLFALAVASAWVNFRERVKTEQALSRYLAEQQERRTDRRQSAPIFLDSAMKALALAQLDQARAHADVAAEFDPELAETWRLKTHLAIAGRDYAGAIAALQEYIALNPADEKGGQLLRGLERVGADESPERISELFELLLAQKAFAAAAVMSQSPQSRLRLYREQLATAWPGQERNLSADDRGEYHFKLTHIFPEGQPVSLEPLSGIPLVHLDLEGYPIRDLSPLRGMPLTRLALTQCRVSDLSPLEGMPLRELVLWKTPVQDLAPLQHTSLELLNIAETYVSDLSPLRGLPLKHLDAYSTGISDLAPLSGMPLDFLNVAATPAADLTPLRGLPIVHLDLFETRISSIEPLAGMPLRWLNLGKTTVTDLDPLKGLPLEHLDLWQAPVSVLTPLIGAPLTSLNIAQTPVEDLSPLSVMPLTNLNLNASGVLSIEPLRDLNLTSLNASSSRIRDLAPLRGQPLEYLDLYETPVTDLSPLQGMKLRWLKLGFCTELRDLSPLRGMPLLMLDLHSSDAISDFTPLKECRQLEELYLPRHAADINWLRDLPSLKWITMDAAQFVGRPPPQSAEEFWKRHDAR